MTNVNVCAYECWNLSKIFKKAAGLEFQNHNDFNGFGDVTMINWEQMKCADDSKAVVCDERPFELYGNTVWKPCLFGYICIKKYEYVNEFRRCSELSEEFSPIFCNSAYEYPRNFNCDFYNKFACQRGKRYIYSCICTNGHRNADMKTCANTTICSKGLPEKKFLSSTTEIPGMIIIRTTTAYTVHTTVFHNSTRDMVISQRKCHPGSQFSALLKTIFSILSALNYYYNSR
ncbi:unnamed protein product [Brugia timori]|uniref:EGF-like domain-containing protein n=1 Tax=Brugia timori TaxID=42155 RepID=A0A0R3QMT1_9BILA|nr:unnamed protein product [Brugia timori]